MRNDFAIFIMSYNRADHITTINLLQKSGYTGRYYVVIGDDDPMIETYKTLYGDHLVIFNKDKVKEYIDTYDNFDNKVTILYARNACFDIAEQMGLKYFLQFEDDYMSLEYRYPQDNKLKTAPVTEFDEVCNAYIEFLENTPVTSVAFAQNGDFIGGAQNSFLKKCVKRKIMNSWFCATDRRFKFSGTLNDDVNTYIGLGKTGTIFLSTKDVSLRQGVTQHNRGGFQKSILAKAHM